MLPRRWAAARGPESTILVVLLLTLVLTGVLAVQAYSAARSHRHAAASALGDYAGFAAWEFGRRLEDAVSSRLHRAVLGARLPVEVALFADGAAHDADGLERFRAALRPELAACGCADAVHDVFLLDLSTARLLRAAQRLPPGFESWLSSEFRAELRGDAPPPLPAAEPGGDTPRGPRIRTAPAEGARGGPRIFMVDGSPAEPFRMRALDDAPGTRLVYVVLRDAHGAPGVYGFALDDAAFIATAARAVAEDANLLPPSLTRGRRNDELLALRVITASGGDVYRTPGPPEAAHARDSVTVLGGVLRTEVAVRPHAAAALLIGGLPASRLPLLLTLFLLTLALVSVAVFQLRRQQALARLRSDFVSGVSHELRTPLAQISLFGQLLARDGLNPDQRSQSVRIINEEAQRLHHLVENVLHFSRTGRRQRISRAPTECAALVHAVVDAFAPLARTRGVTIAVHAEAGIVADVDANAIRQVLLNLLDNAVKYGPARQHVNVQVGRDGDELCIMVEDEGPGIPHGERGSVWQPYRRLDRDRDTAVTGSGIGLAVVRQLVGLHGGSVDIQDAPGGGARFSVRLPLSSAREPAPARP